MPETSSIDTIRILIGSDAIDAYKALSDESRRQILHALRARKMSISELVDFLANQDREKEVKPQTVRYHIKELQKCGLVEQDGYEPAGNGDSHIMQKIWRATAENVFLATGDLDTLPNGNSIDLDRTLDIISTMRSLDLVMSGEDEMRQVAETLTERDQLYKKGKELAIETLRSACEIDPKLYIVFRKLLSVVQLNEADYQRYWELNRELTDTLREAYRRGKGKNPEVF
ncbi:MAG: winged helix-turn-helix transcriptional regulator [Candidatus Thorarchaeota archaeon]|nr:winged helix-turn-helix transcriptional regulator [Candidatus Thorarchaeota archaeon]